MPSTAKLKAPPHDVLDEGPENVLTQLISTANSSIKMLMSSCFVKPNMKTLAWYTKACQKASVPQCFCCVISSSTATDGVACRSGIVVHFPVCSQN